MIRIALRSEHRLFRDALASYLDARPECAIVGSVADLGDLAVLCALRHPDVALADIGPEFDGRPEPLGRLRTCAALASVVVVYERLSPAELGALWQLGVDALLPRSRGLDALLTLLRQPPRRINGGRDALTEQEQKIIALICAGHTADQIAQLLEISAVSVTNAKRRIYRKLAVASQSQAVARAAAFGIVTRRLSTPALGAAALPELTARECDILRSIADGHTVRQTARSIGIAAKTVENTQARLFRKLGVRNRAGALATAHALGLVDIEPTAAAAQPTSGMAGPSRSSASTMR